MNLHILNNVDKDVYVRVYEGNKMALSVGKIDLYKDAFTLGPGEKRVYNVTVDSVSLKAKLLGLKDVRAGTITIERRGTKAASNAANVTVAITAIAALGGRGYYALQII